jgi:hypothetical protein
MWAIAASASFPHASLWSMMLQHPRFLWRAGFVPEAAARGQPEKETLP